MSEAHVDDGELHLDEYGDQVGVLFEAEEFSIPDIDRPWNPDQIRVTTKSFSLRNILDLIDGNELDLAPDFQRLRVWKPVQKSQLIESILLQIPLPAFYFAEDDEGILRVVDGVQRLSTIHDYCRGSNGRGGFALSGLEYVADVWGLRFSDLPAQWQRRIHNTQITANVIDPSTPTPVMYDIFRRINTGGTPLNAQEIRHCMSRQRSRDLLQRLAHLDEFTLATSGLLLNQRRMIDREVVLRFIAFWTRGVSLYDNTMEEFLWSTTEQLDDPRRMPSEAIYEAEDAFRRGLRRAHAIFGEHAFRKWPSSDDRLKPFNRALFESWTVELARLNRDPAPAENSAIATAARDAMQNDSGYMEAISASTGDRRRVFVRFETAAQIISRACS